MNAYSLILAEPGKIVKIFGRAKTLEEVKKVEAVSAPMIQWLRSRWSRSMNLCRKVMRKCCCHLCNTPPICERLINNKYNILTIRKGGIPSSRKRWR